MPTQVDLCERVTDWLNLTAQQDQLPETFTAVHSSRGFIDKPEAGQLYVIVFPGERAIDMENRTRWEKQAEASIGIVERIAKRTVAGQDERERELRTLHEAIEDLTLGMTVTGFTRNEEVGQVTAQFSRDGLYEDGTFHAEVTMAFSYEVNKTRG